MSWITEMFGERVCEMNLPAVKGKMRHRFGNGRTYRVPADEANERTIRDNYLALCGDSFKDWADEVRLRVDYQRPYPESKPKYQEGEPDTDKPDVDNVLKLVMDALNGVAYRDDAQVTEAVIRKHPRFRRRQAYLRIEVTYISNTAVREPRSRKERQPI